jgi:glucose/arabinose dehydrogenase
MTKPIIAAAVFAGLVLSAMYLRNAPASPPRQNRTPIPQAVQNNDSRNAPLISTVSSDLDTPWAIAFLPDGSLLVTERTGNLSRILLQDGSVTRIATIDDARELGEGGLMGIAVSPDFGTNQRIFLYCTYAGADNRTLNRLVRYRYDGSRLSERTVLIDAIPGSSNHNGGRIKFGPDGYLYVTTGDAADPSLSQNRDSLAGKILRVTEDGKPAPDNPYGDEIFTLGHRNPQGLAWDGNNMYETEHGPSAKDEINTITMGENYGWPDVTGSGKKPGTRSPLYQSGSDTWAPSGALFLDGSLYFAGLRGNALYRLTLHDGAVTLKEYFKNDLGRIREAVLGPDNMIYITTSNRDGRGSPQETDDRVMRVNPRKLD